MREADVGLVLEKIRSDYEEVLKEQRERIVSLREENRSLEKQLDAFRKREAEAGETLALAAEKAREIESAAKLRYRTEIQRLHEFHERWVRYYEQIEGLAPAEDRAEMNRLLGRMDRIFEERPLIGEDSPAGIRKRAADPEPVTARPAPELRPENGKGERPDPEADKPFDLSEVLYPKNLPDLATLCRELGIKQSS